MPRLLPALTFGISTALLPVLGGLHYALAYSDMASAFAQSASLVSAFTLMSFAYSVLTFLFPTLFIRPYLRPRTHFTILATLGVFGTAAMTSLSRWQNELAAVTMERVWIQMIGVTKGEAWAHASVQRYVWGKDMRTREDADGTVGSGTRP